MTTALVHRYQPHGVCDALFDFEGPEVLLSGPAGTGKSRACLERLLFLALSHPGMKGLIVRKTAVSLTSTALATFRKDVAAEYLRTRDVEWYGGSQQEPAQYRLRNGSALVVGGMDKADKIMSSEYDVIYVQEAIELSEDDWEKCTTRLRNGVLPFQQMIADTNPSQPGHWLNQRCASGRTKMLHAKWSDNPRYVNADGTYTAAGETYIQGTLANLTGVRKERLYHGRWVAAEGVIYDGWDDNVHMLDRAPIPTDWARYWSIDFGFTNPFVCQIWAEDPDGRVILDREIYRTGTLVEDHAAQLKKLVTPKVDGRPAEQPRPRWIVADHDAEGRATFERHFGQSTMPAKKNVTDGIQAVASRLKVVGDGRPRLMLMRDAVISVDQALRDEKKPTCTAEEIPAYIWADGKKKEEPVKQDDHGCDAMRYLVAELDVGGRPRMRFVNY